MADCRDLIEICKGRHIYIQTHNFPDPDAIASAYGLHKLFEHFGITSTLCYEGKIDKLSTRKMTEIFNINILSYDQIRQDMSEDDYIVCVDSQKGGGNITDFIGDEIACIDHHPIYVNTEYKYSDIRFVGSCATIIAKYFEELEIPMDSVTASALMYGLKMDTLNLSRGTTYLDIDMFKYLYTRADNDLLKKVESNNMEFSDLKAYGAAIKNIKLFGTVGFAYIPFSCPDALIGIISDFILDLNSVDVTVVYSKREDGYKFSIRSENPDVNAGEIISKALKGIGNGGGHPTMAGGLIKAEDVHKLGAYPDNTIIDIFTSALGEHAK
ncbi:MAG: DHH family phosphoesterase [Lachnospiraceae bacterium]|nr:DHH family phosphoesterase [Lachnospiraceae bacterium]